MGLHAAHPALKRMRHHAILLIYITMGVWYTALRLNGLVGLDVLIWPDSNGHARVADLLLFSSGFYSDIRGMAAPLIATEVPNRSYAHLLKQLGELLRVQRIAWERSLWPWNRKCACYRLIGSAC